MRVPLETYWEFNHFRRLVERALLSDLVSEIRTDDVVYDVGAYLGWHTLFAAKAARDGTTVAFEPHPVSHKRLQEVLRHAEGHVRTYNYALSDVKKTVAIPKNSSSGAEISETGSDGYEAKTIRGDALVDSEDLPLPNVIKIDVEGMEKEVLDGLEKTIATDECRVIYCEMHPQKSALGNKLYSEIVDDFERAGFEWSVLPDTERVTLKAKRTEVA